MITAVNFNALTLAIAGASLFMGTVSTQASTVLTAPGTLVTVDTNVLAHMTINQEVC